jgi:hypothetical protein
LKRKGNLYNTIISIENLRIADAKAQKGKSNKYGVILHNRNAENNLIRLHELLVNKHYQTSPYTTFKVFEPKEREVFRLPYFPDRIVHHAIMNVLEPMFIANFTADTYSCIKGKGIHAAAKAVNSALIDTIGTKYCLKLDVRKFYPTINHDVLKALLRKKIKDNDLLWLLDEIIDSSDGLPIGNYLSQYFANFYLSYFDHWLKETLKVKYYYRYADDIVILASNKTYLRNLYKEIKSYLNNNLKLEIKRNWQVFPVSARGLDFVGYKFYHTHTMLRKSIKQKFARKLKQKPNKQTIAAYNGWLKHCNAVNLKNTLLNEHI